MGISCWTNLYKAFFSGGDIFTRCQFLQTLEKKEKKKNIRIKSKHLNRVEYLLKLDMAIDNSFPVGFITSVWIRACKTTNEMETMWKRQWK